jgi:hypothetical protein
VLLCIHHSVIPSTLHCLLREQLHTSVSCALGFHPDSGGNKISTMKPTLVLFAATARLVLSSPIAKPPDVVPANNVFLVDKPSNFYIEKDLDTKVSATPNGTVSVVRYG